MSGYAIARSGQPLSPNSGKTPRASNRFTRADDAQPLRSVAPRAPQASMLDALLAELAERVAVAVAARLRESHDGRASEWLDSRDAADYLGVHRDTLRKLATERAIPAHQEGPGCKLFFQRSDLDEWRRTGGRVVQLSSVVADAA